MVPNRAGRTAAETGPAPASDASACAARVAYGSLPDSPADGATGVFARIGWNDGRTESFAFTEADRTLSAGAQLSGTHWGRSEDHVAVAFAFNGISRDHRDYLAAGGSGFVLGDGRLSYAREQIAEVYYSAKVNKYITLSPDFQFVRHPGYNADRGPARFVGLRAHVEL